MALTLTHVLDDRFEVRHDGLELYRYVYRPCSPTVESPRPYFHPLRTLAGDVVTILRPHDHPWHHGVSLTSAQLSGQNFWGGPTFVRDEGYVQLDNNGRVQHVAWEAMAPERLTERLRWMTQAGEVWVEERREIGLAGVDPTAGDWALGLAFELENVSDGPLEFGSPTTEGRPAAGYGGLFWRGPRSFRHGRIQAGGGQEGPDAMGRRAPWLAFTGRHDTTLATSTVVFVDDPGNPRHPTQWFVRDDPYACAAAAFTFDRPYVLDAGERLRQRYLVIVACGELEGGRIEERAARYASPD